MLHVAFTKQHFQVAFFPACLYRFVKDAATFWSVVGGATLNRISLKEKYIHNDSLAVVKVLRNQYLTTCKS